MKYRIDEERLADIIDNSEFISDNRAANESLRMLLKNTIHGMCQYNQEILEEIKREILYPKPPCAVGAFTCALVPLRDKDAYGHIGLSVMSEQSLSRKIVFLDGEYDEIKEICGDNQTEKKIYTGSYRIKNQEYSFKYRLKFDNSLLKMQDLTVRLSACYPVGNAVLFSPYMRKSFVTEVLDQIPKNVEDKDIDFRFSQNKIPAVQDAVLLWNLKVTHTSLLKAADRRPYGAELKYRHHFDRGKGGRWPYALPMNNQTIIYDIRFTEEGTDLILDHEMEEFIVAEYHPVDFDSADIKKLNLSHKIFSNQITKSTLGNKRILSKGDIMYAVSPFKDYGGIQCEVAEKLDKICTRYSSKYRNHLSDRIGYRKLKTINLKFTSEIIPKFMDDYINYVLMYLEYYYPEIEWVGGR